MFYIVENNGSRYYSGHLPDLKTVKKFNMYKYPEIKLHEVEYDIDTSDMYVEDFEEFKNTEEFQKFNNEMKKLDLRYGDIIVNTNEKEYRSTGIYFVDKNLDICRPGYIYGDYGHLPESFDIFIDFSPEQHFKLVNEKYDGERCIYHQTMKVPIDKIKIVWKKYKCDKGTYYGAEVDGYFLLVSEMDEKNFEEPELRNMFNLYKESKGNYTLDENMDIDFSSIRKDYKGRKFLVQAYFGHNF